MADFYLFPCDSDVPHIANATASALRFEMTPSLTCEREQNDSLRDINIASMTIEIFCSSNVKQ